MGVHEQTPLVSKLDLKQSQSRPPVFVYFIVGCAALNSVNLGYDIGVNSGVAVLIQDDFGLSDAQVGAFMGVLHFIAACGGLMNQAVSDRLGRCLTFTIAQIVLVAGVVVLCVAGSFATLMVGRLFVGMGVGLGLAIDPLYMAEVAPAEYRGMLTAWAEIAVNLGVLFGFVANWAFAGLPLGQNWRVMLACGAALPMALFVLSLTVMPESPRWLVARGLTAQAQEVLARTHAAGVDTSEIVSKIRSQLQEDKENDNQGWLGWAPILKPDRVTRRMLLVGIGVALAQQINGSESIVLYSPEIFKGAGVAQTHSALFAVTIIVGVVKVFFIVVSAFMLDNVGRRPLLLISIFGMAACQFVLSIALAHEHGWLASSAVWLFIAFFSVGIGPITWILAAEVFPLHIRSKGLSLAAFVNRITSALIVLTFLPLSRAMGLPRYYFLFACITTCTGMAAFYLVPETKQRTLEQLSDVFYDLAYGTETCTETRESRGC